VHDARASAVAHDPAVEPSTAELPGEP